MITWIISAVFCSTGQNSMSHSTGQVPSFSTNSAIQHYSMWVSAPYRSKNTLKHRVVNFVHALCVFLGLLWWFLGCLRHWTWRGVLGGAIFAARWKKSNHEIAKGMKNKKVRTTEIWPLLLQISKTQIIFFFLGLNILNSDLPVCWGHRSCRGCPICCLGHAMDKQKHILYIDWGIYFVK